MDAAESVRVIIYLFANVFDNPDCEVISMTPGRYSFSRLKDVVVPLLCAHVDFTSHQIRAGQWFVLPKPPSPRASPVLVEEGEFSIMDECERDVDGSKCIVVDLRGGE